MKPPIKYLSVCSGIEAATCAWHHMGWEPVGFSEIEPFPSAVLAHHYPDTPNLGDMTKYREWNIGAIDLLVGGTPCQSFSVAGLRKGLEDPRGNLALVYCGILDHFKPKWFVWENVPGVLSSNGGRDFGSFLGAVAELGYGFAYRVLDAQYFGVAQRRRRVFVVGYLGDWEPAAKVLFEPESLRGNPAPSREKGKEIAGTIIRSTFGGGPGGKPEAAAVGHFQPVTGSPTAKGPCAMGAPEVDAGHYLPVSAAAQFKCFQQNTRDEVRYIGGDGQIAGALAAEAGMKQQNYIQQPISIHPHCIGRSPQAGPQGKEYLTDGTAYCMDSRGQPQAVAQPISYGIRTANTSSNGWGIQEEATHTLDRAQGLAVAQPVNIYGGNKRSDRPEGGVYVRMDEETSKTLDAASGLNPTCSQGGTAVMQSVAFSEVGATLKGGSGERGYPDPSDGNGHNIVGQSVAPTLTATNDPSRSPQSSEVTKQVEAVLMASMAVRRLTPVECERLQGFPTVLETVKIQACIDHQNSVVRAAIQCRRLQNNAWSADESESLPNVKTAARPSSTHQVDTEPLAALHVRMHSVDELLEVRSLGRSIWSASGAAASNQSLPHTLNENTVQELARLLREVAHSVRSGKAASLLNISLSFPASFGETSAEKFGPETAGNVSDATKDQNKVTFTTSDLGLITTSSDSTAATLCCSVLRAIAGCIPEITLAETFSIELTVETPYTLIPWRGKTETPDGPRYKALGNSMAVPVMRWIGERIQGESNEISH